MLVYLAAISLTAIWVDWSLMRFVAAADATAVVAVLAGILSPISVASKGTAAVAASIETSDAAVLAEAKARAIAGASHYSLAKAASLCVALAFASVLECGAEDVRPSAALGPRWSPPESPTCATTCCRSDGNGHVRACMLLLFISRPHSLRSHQDSAPPVADDAGHVGCSVATAPRVLARPGEDLGAMVDVAGRLFVHDAPAARADVPRPISIAHFLSRRGRFPHLLGASHDARGAVLRRHVHSVHHEYTAVFSCGCGWVHPLEDIVAVICQAIPVLLIRPHPLTQWLFAALWVVCLVDEHSGHDVWWSPYQLLPIPDAHRAEALHRMTSTTTSPPGTMASSS